VKKKNFKDKKNRQLRDEVWEKTGWGKVASWYDNTISASKSTQKDLLLPELLKFLPLESAKDKKIIDLGCGTGFFLKEYIQAGADKSLGIDIDKELLELAEENLRDEVESGKVVFMQGDASNLKNIGERSFDIVLSVESIPNISDLKSLAKEVYRILEVGGKFVAVVNHPAFRVPKSADWYFSKDLQKQGRVVYKYRTTHAIKIDMNPGTKNQKQKVFTTTFHRPFEEYMNTFVKSGLKFSFMKEVYSNKVSQTGTRKKAEDEARSEIPMFLFLEFTK
jgi:ubiquinone/menaquinone biosynthesis C-methylase UbiE